MSKFQSIGGLLSAYAELPRDYDELVARLRLRPITSEAARKRAASLVLAAEAGKPRWNRDQRDYFTALGVLLADYERKHHGTAEPLDPLEALAGLMEEHDMSNADLARLLGVSRAQAGRLVSGERSLTVTQIATLADRFNVNPRLFMPAHQAAA